LHAWPEHGYCAIDLFTCNLTLDLSALIERLKMDFGAESCSLCRLQRHAQVNDEAALVRAQELAA
jgi:S-adenosylmethionine decarboxylase